jgi:hypothetical protein
MGVVLIKNLLRSAVLSTAAVFVLAGVGAAATVTVSTQGSNAFKDTSGQNAWYQTVSYSLNGIARTAAAGLFRLTSTAADGSVTRFVSVCLEPLETLRLPKLYDESTPLGQSVVGALGALLANALPQVQDSKTAAAFQLAAWEIANESSGLFNLGGGAFKVGTAKSATLALAQSWLDQIGTGAWAPDTRITILSAAGTQDLLTDLPAEVPVPAAGLLLLGGIGGLAALGRRRQRITA